MPTVEQEAVSRRSRAFLVTACLGLLASSAAWGGAVPTRVERGEGGCRLLRGDKPYLIEGVGGSDQLELLAKCGGNSIRTWDAKGIGPLLDRAQKLGLTVAVGIWLGQERQGFNYAKADAVAEQQERARRYILQLKDHPAVLLWGIGNEMEGSGDNAAVWMAVNAIAAMAHKLDPNHPTMTVIAEVGGSKVRDLHRLCPDIDVVGINSYAGLVSLPERYRKAGGSKPYVVTEFGPPGHWEVAKTPWGAPVEPTSTEKADWYRRGYRKAVLGSGGLCLGSYAFLWGHKQEATATWFGMLLPDGAKVGPVDAMTELWSGKAPANRCPAIAKLALSADRGLEPGQTVTATLAASDPDGDRLAVRWVLRPESGAYATGGDAQAAMPDVAEALVRSDAAGATVRVPKSGGGYRLFATVRDGQGAAATANVPLQVEGPERVFKAPRAKLPLALYEDGLKDAPYVPSGWMGKTDAIAVDDGCTAKPHGGKTCMRVAFKSPDGWGGVVWQSPPDDWGDRPGGYDLSGAKRLVAWVRGETGGEKIELKLGILGNDKRFHDSAAATAGTVTLATEWRQVVLPLAGKDLSCIKTGFCWVVAGQGKPVVFYLDDVRYE